ncbi:MAG: hypothetical protein JO090_11405 [Rhizobacter sp.]|nr:hypothetical protein [Rhizobacter sp.]
MRVDAFRVSRRTVTNAQFARFDQSDRARAEHDPRRRQHHRNRAAILVGVCGSLRQRRLRRETERARR